MEITMSKKVLNKIVRLLLVFITLSIGMLFGCTKAKEVIEPQKSIPTQPISVTDVPNDKVLIVTGEYAPYVGETLENKGFITELIEATLKVANIDYEIKFYPWARCSEMVESGEAWASYPFGHSEVNDQTYLFSDILYTTKHKFYYLTTNEKITDEVNKFTTIGDFTDYTFGGANGYWYGKPDDFADLGVTAEWAGDTDALLKMLYSKRIDFFIEDELVCEEAIKRLFPGEEEKFATLTTNARIQEYYLMVSKEYPRSEELLKEFNTSLSEVMDYVLNKD
jgi:polar amino acid transport system substrate-binding protein